MRISERVAECMRARKRARIFGVRALVHSPPLVWLTRMLRFARSSTGGSFTKKLQILDSVLARNGRWNPKTLLYRSFFVFTVRSEYVYEGLPFRMNLKIRDL